MFGRRSVAFRLICSILSFYTDCIKANHIAASGIFNTVKDRCERMRGNLIASQRLAASLIQLKEGVKK